MFSRSLTNKKHLVNNCRVTGSSSHASHYCQWTVVSCWSCIGICTCTIGKKKRKRNAPIYFNTNYRTEVKLVPIIVDYCPLQFDALNFFLIDHLHEESQPNFSCFNVNLQICQRKCKVHLTNCLETKFHDISIISLRVSRRRNYS